MRRVEPRLLHQPADPERRDRAKVQIIQRAVAYQEAEGLPAFRDWTAYIVRWRDQLEDDLRWGSLRRGRAFGTTDDELRAMLYVLRLVLDIPAEARAAYDRLRAVEAEATRARERAETRFGPGIDAD